METPTVTAAQIEFEDVSEPYFQDIKNMPRNKWILGSINGKIYFKKGSNRKILIAKILGNDLDDEESNPTVHKKKFKVEDFASVDKAKEHAKRYAINYAHHNNLVRNKVMISKKGIEFMLDNGKKTNTDLEFLSYFIPKGDRIRCKYELFLADNGYVVMYDTQSKKMSMFHEFIMLTAMETGMIKNRPSRRRS